MLDNKEITLKSGNIVTIQHCNFLTKQRLLNAFTAEAKTNGFNLATLEYEGALLDALVNLVLSLSSNPIIEELFWECAKTCLWNGEKIQPKLFELEAERAIPDYLEIKFHIIKENLAIFFSSLLSGSLKTNSSPQAVAETLKSLVSK